MIGIGLHRHDREFTQGERDTVELLRPHLQQICSAALARAEARRVMKAGEDALESRGEGVLLLEGDNLMITYATSLGSSLVARYFPAWKTRGALPVLLREQIRAHLGGGATSCGFFHPTEEAELRVDVLRSLNTGELILILREHLKSWRSLLRLGLTARQAEVLYWVSERKTNAEIAAILNASTFTIARHVSAILQKLGFESRWLAADEARVLLGRPI
jgi:DNA-binding CsgD family transcriptional regulator